MLEKMDAFFEARLDGYEAHMLRNIAGAAEFYPFTAQHLPLAKNAAILDLGCGTGLELDYYFALNPSARVTGIDLSAKMLQVLKEKFPDKQLTLRCGSYFELPLGSEVFDGAVSVESLHHFTKAEKISLYRRLYAALKPDSSFVLTDYFALTDQEEADLRRQLLLLKETSGTDDGQYYHFDTPLTVAHEMQALLEAGFKKVEVLKNWGATYTLKAQKT